MLNFMTSKTETDKILAIVSDAEIRSLLPDSKIVSIMDLAATHCSGCPLDFDKLAGFDDFNMAHDLHGIRRNINTTTGELENCFLPRCAK